MDIKVQRMSFKAHMFNFTRLGLIIGIVFTIFMAFNWLFGQGAVIDMGDTKWTGLAAYAALVLVPIMMALNGFLFGLISYFPYKCIESLTLKKK